MILGEKFAMDSEAGIRLTGGQRQFFRDKQEVLSSFGHGRDASSGGGRRGGERGVFFGSWAARRGSAVGSETSSPFFTGAGGETLSSGMGSESLSASRFQQRGDV